MYKEFKALDLATIDKEILDFWQKESIFQKSIDQKDANNPFVFYEGPPSANGQPGIHHVMARAVKDLFCRYQTMKGKRVDRKGGWDTHGLPIELSVEKELGITKEDIGQSISIVDYNLKCRETVMRYKDMWDDITMKMGYWVDLEHPYITFESEYMESVWYLLKMLYDKKLLYKGYSIQPFSPAAGTGLSSHELNQPGTYRLVKDTSAVAQFKLKENEASEFLFKNGSDHGSVFALAWTTTPWTLPSNTALAVGENIDYCLVKTFNPYTHLPVRVIVAEALIPNFFKKNERKIEEYKAGDKEIPFEIIGKFKGKQLENIKYDQLLPYAIPNDGDAFRIIIGDFVSTEDGTGIVHIAPSFGADDMRVAKKNGIGSLTLVDKTGKFVDAVTDFAGRYVKDYKDEGTDYRSVDVDISIKLKEENKAFNVQKYEHNYPHCWRTDKPILYYPLDSWFIKTTQAKDRMIELNNTINWKPESTGSGRFGNWLENLQDWNLSRSRFWGIPLPIWRSSDGKEEICIGSVEELNSYIKEANEKLGLDQVPPADLHRPYIDEVILVSPTGQRMTRETDLIDVWFDSGSMPYAQWGYPKHEIKGFPADFIAEGVDQTRGWFFTLHAIAVMCFDSVAFKNVVSNGLVQDKFGQKMSKRLGNTIEPFETIAKYGADATRWYIISNSQPWDNLKFDVNGIDEVRRKFLGTLYNTYSFFALYANLDKFEYKENEIPIHERPEIDRWVISLLNTLIKNVDEDYAQYEPTNAARKIQEFVDEHLSNWYVRLCRRRFWKGEYSKDKISAYQTLYTCLTEISKMMAPVAPFFSDWLYKNLDSSTQKEGIESVHLTDFPKYNEALVDKDLEDRMEMAQTTCSLILSLRKKERLRVRQPLNKVIIPVFNAETERQFNLVRDLILSEVNVKDLELVREDTTLIKKKIKANFKTLGSRLGADMKSAVKLIEEMGQDAIKQIETTKGYKMVIGSNTYDLTLEDFIISSEDIPGWLVASDKGITVALDISLNDALMAEGYARELVNRVQNMRKSQDFKVTDRILVVVEKNEQTEQAIAHFANYIKAEILADDIQLVQNPEGESVEWLDDKFITISVKKV